MLVRHRGGSCFGRSGPRAGTGSPSWRPLCTGRAPARTHTRTGTPSTLVQKWVNPNSTAVTRVPFGPIWLLLLLRCEYRRWRTGTRPGAPERGGIPPRPQRRGCGIARWLGGLRSRTRVRPTSLGGRPREREPGPGRPMRRGRAPTEAITEVEKTGRGRSPPKSAVEQPPNPSPGRRAHAAAAVQGIFSGEPRHRAVVRVVVVVPAAPPTLVEAERGRYAPRIVLGLVGARSLAPQRASPDPETDSSPRDGHLRLSLLNWGGALDRR